MPQKWGLKFNKNRHTILENYPQGQEDSKNLIDLIEQLLKSLHKQSHMVTIDQGMVCM